MILKCACEDFSVKIFTLHLTPSAKEKLYACIAPSGIAGSGNTCDGSWKPSIFSNLDFSNF